MFPKNKEYFFNKDGVKVGVFLELETYEEIQEKMKEYEEMDEILSDIEDQYLGEIALQRMKDYEEGKAKTVSFEEMMKRLGLADEIPD